jgi:beta-galactosidase
MATEIKKWKDNGANRVQTATTYSVAATYGNYVEIVNTSANTAVAAQSVTTTTTYKIYPTGEINVSERYVFGASTNAYINVIGGYLKLMPGMENITYFARGPEENYVDRKTGNDVGVYSTTVSKNYTEYITSQDTGERLDTRWAAVTDDDGFGVIMKAGQFAANDLFSGSPSAYNYAEAPYNMSNLVEFNALHYSPTQFGDARQKHPYQVYDEFGRNDASLPTYLYVNVASRGRGADTSWGTQATPKGVYRLNITGKTVNYNFSILPVDNFSADSAMTYSKTLRSAYQNVKDLMPTAAAAGVLTGDPAYVAANALASSAAELTAVNVYNALYAAIEDTKTLNVNITDGLATASITFDSAPPEGAKILIAFFNTDGKLIDLIESAQTVASGNFIRTSVAAAVPLGADSVKAFYWGRDYVPLFPAAQALIE